MQPALDLTRTAWSARHGDITVHGTWFRNEDGSEPCLALVPTHWSLHQGAAPCVVPLSMAWVWDEKIGDGKRCARVAYEFARALKMGTEMSQVFQIVGIIHDHLGDLLAMKPEPKDTEGHVVLGEATITDRQTGKVISHQIIGHA